MIWKRNIFQWVYLGLLLIIFSAQLLLPNTASSQSISTYNPADYNLLGATSYISGELTDIQANDATSMRFRGNYGTDISDFIDNISDVDSFMDIGTHSNFTAQTKGPNSIQDTLTEQNTENIAYKEITIPSEQATTNTAWTDVLGANVNFTPKSSTEEWLVFVTADIRSNSTTENQARFRYSINGVSSGEIGVQQGTINPTPIIPHNVYFHFTRITGVTSQQTVKFQYQASSGVTAFARNVHILCIRLDPANLEYTEVNGDISIAGTQTLATLQFTPPSIGDYIIAYCVMVSELPSGSAGAETWLDFDSGTSLYPAEWSPPNTRRIHTDSEQFEPHGLLTRINLTTSQHTFAVGTRLRVASENSTARDVRITAFRVDAFDLLEFDEDTAVSSTTQVETVRSVVNTQDPGEQRDYLILAGIHTISNGISSREAGGIEIDDVIVQRKGDQRLSFAEIARIASHHVSIKTTNTSFKVETTYGTGGVGFDTIHSKQSVIYILKIPKNYELDLEVQWINATHNVSNAELCIFGMTLGSEKISVDVWNGTTWQNLLVDLTIGWNNISVSNYLYSSTFTIRFKGGNETGDTSQDSWNIDVTLLHIWSNDMAVEVEFLGSSNIDNWFQLTWTVDSAWTTGSVNVTLQLYNYTLNDYSPSGNGYVSYTSNPILDENETVDQIVTANPTHFRNATGHWKVKIKGVKAVDSQLELQVDLIKYEVALPQSFDWTTVIVCTGVVLGFLLPFAVRFKRKKKRHKPTASTHTFPERFGVTPQQMVGKKTLLEVDPTLDYHNALFGFVSKAITDDQSLFIFTGKNSPLHTAFCVKNIGFFLLTSKVSSSKRISKKEVLIPVSDLSVLLDAFAKILRERTRKPRTILFDNISDTILMSGFDKTYRFLRFLLEAISSPKITALFIFNPSAHDPAISSSIRGLFQFRLTDLKPKIVESIRRD